VHRDLKPGNVIVGKHGETLVVDWGLAKATAQADPGSGERPLRPYSASGSAETPPGSALGTPAYMSPEQAEGDLEHLGPRSDVYCLGATRGQTLPSPRRPLRGGKADLADQMYCGR
jgi:serine/threonine protein kinase